MSDQSDFEFASQFVASNEIDQAGKDILNLLNNAAADRRHALETAQRLSHQLQNAENRIAQLEAEVQLYREKSERAQDWLRKISTEIEDRLISKPEELQRQSPWL